MVLGIVIVVAVVFSLSASTVFAQDMCVADFDYDTDVDGTDAAVFKADFDRDGYSNPCLPNGPAPVPQTGQTTSYRTGDDGDLEKGVIWPYPRFTDNLDGTITDNLTGLIWLKNANCFGTRTWNLALSDSNGLENGECELTDGSSPGDWRLPNKKELLSLLDDGYFGPALSNTAGTGHWSQGDPFNNVQSTYYWTSTTYAGNSIPAWDIDLGTGYVLSEGKNTFHYLWPVRGGH